MGPSTYDMICLGDSLDTHDRWLRCAPRRRQPAHWISYLSVENVDAAAQAVTANGGRVIDKPFDIPTVGRTARVADPQGAELCLFKSDSGDPPDGIAPHGGWVWNELHTSDPAKAIAFYEKVIGYTHKSMNMGPDEVYHVLSRDGVDRAGVTPLLQKSAQAQLAAVHLGRRRRRHHRARPQAGRDDPDGPRVHPRRRAASAR